MQVHRAVATGALVERVITVISLHPLSLHPTLFNLTLSLEFGPWFSDNFETQITLI